VSAEVTSTSKTNWADEHIHFVTGRLAEFALRETVDALSRRIGFRYSIDVLRISVAALMTPQWVATRIQPAGAATCVLLPGYCEGDLTSVEQAVRRRVLRGPRDLRQLPAYFDLDGSVSDQYGDYDIEILAEINHAPNQPRSDLLAEAKRLQAHGADVIDLGCNAGETWAGVGEAVAALRDEGCRVSIDSFNTTEVENAIDAGAELVLSVNNTNRHAAADWGCEVVAIPDDPHSLTGLDETIELLTAADVPVRVDPVLSPIGFGFADSLGRYFEARRQFPEMEMMMGIGNLTELTDADSAGINVILLGLCQELGIRSVLTTQVINWARSAVQECDLARRLVHHAVTRQMLPKHVEPRLVMLRDPDVPQYDKRQLQRLAEEITDRNYRIFAEPDGIHVISAGVHLTGDDAFAIFEELLSTDPPGLDRGHAFYLGYEMAKAATALTLSKDYRQDEVLDWGLLTQPEQLHQRIRDPKG
jgi:dihydropteroate synthase-like protein